MAEICRRLDGIALAIELAARRTDAFAASELLSLLKDRFQLLTHGRRTDLPRHQTLAAAIAVVGDDKESKTNIAADIGNLVAKSLVSVETSGQCVQYRLLDSMRAYARQKLEQSGEVAALLRRHAQHHLALFRRAEAEWENRPPEDWLADYGRCIDDVAGWKPGGRPRKLQSG